MKLLPYKIESYGLSDVGLSRPNNEDIFQIVPEKQFFILADGVGGHNAGEIASVTAVESMCNAIQHVKESDSIETVCRHLRATISSANERVYKLSHQNKAYKGMGTTLSCFLLRENVLVYAHVGDSRIYRMRHKLQQLTEDHSLRHLLLAAEESSPSLYRNVITRAIGTQPYVIPDIGVIPLQPKDIYMLCSDGLTDCVPEETIEHILSSPLPLKESASQLIQCALEKGGNDNITVLLVKIVPP